VADQHPRRKFLRLAAGAAALPAVSWSAEAQSYPARPVRLIVPIAPGGAGDITARLIGQWLSERLAQPFIIENRPGAGGNIGAEAVARARPDGYTLLLAGSNLVAGSNDAPRLVNFNFIRDIAPVAGIIRAPFAMAVNQSFPAKTVPEFITYAKANPGKLSIAMPGVMIDISGELFKIMAGVDMTNVPYRGGAPALTDLIGGQVQVMFIGPGVIEYIRTGKLRALAVTTATRSEWLPDIPTMGDFLPGFETSVWFGVGAPKNTPLEIVDKLNKEINAGLADTKIKARLANMAATPIAGSSAEFGKLIADETEKWGKVIRAINIKAK
jgi:tripartite-type tricarboxylate transporter receptor subunit TctC